ncbi:hypothetical protein Pla144_45740 [Bythopirellula polymerisocia]|uniref:Uncharacterized protein n=1 Tax=Bythopirellula polymerisocia TaxID=2528003 RepID=A0A5C6CD08_9BACT|nr:hypothetical protein Pla144_45740 [Bythopirellula polymerisocia]
MLLHLMRQCAGQHVPIASYKYCSCQRILTENLQKIPVRVLLIPIPRGWALDEAFSSLFQCGAPEVGDFNRQKRINETY